MVESLSLDTAAAEAVSRELMGIAAELAARLDRANSGLTAVGAAWGNDAAGKAFAKSYVPDSAQVTAAGKDAVTGLQTLGAGISALVRSIEEADRQGAQQITASDPASPAAPVGTVVTPQAATGVSVDSAEPTADAVSEPQTQQPDVASSADSPASAATQPADQPVTQSPSATQPPNTTQPDAPNSPQQPSQPGSAPAGAQPAAQSPEDAGSPATQAMTRNQPATPSRLPTGLGGRPVSDRGDNESSRAAADSEAEQPETTRPARVSAPMMNPGIPPDGTRPTDEEEDAEEKQQRRPPQPGDRVNAREAAVERCTRHGVEVTGFDDPDVAEDVLVEIAAAVEAICGKYPWIGVRRVGIAPLDPGEWARTRWDCVPGEDGPVPYTDHILFASAAAREPGEFANIITEATQSGHLVVGSQVRPMYSTIIREFGHAMDVAGGFAAGTQAHRRLISAYLGGDDGRKDESLARVVGGFHDWRAALPRCSLRGGRFHPPAALAEAFTEVELHGEAACVPAKALHRLLVDTARPAGEAQ